MSANLENSAVATPVDRAIEFLEENIFNAHGNRPYLSGNQLEGAVVVVAGNAVEQGE